MRGFLRRHPLAHESPVAVRTIRHASEPAVADDAYLLAAWGAVPQELAAEAGSTVDELLQGIRCERVE